MNNNIEKEIKKEDLIKYIENIKTKDAWDKGVKDIAIMVIENREDEKTFNLDTLEKTLLNGAEDWKQYSWGGSALVYNEDIVKTFCTPSEQKRYEKTHSNFANKNEEWLDVQARGLYQAYILIKNSCIEILKSQEKEKKQNNYTETDIKNIKAKTPSEEMVETENKKEGQGLK